MTSIDIPTLEISEPSEMEGDPSDTENDIDQTETVEIVEENCKILDEKVIAVLSKWLDLDTLKTLRQVCTSLRDLIIPIMFNQNFLSLSPLIKPRLNDILRQAENFRQFIQKYCTDLTFPNVKLTNVSLLHFQDGLFHDFGSHVIGPTLTHLKFCDWPNADEQLTSFCQFIREGHLTNLRVLVMPKLPPPPINDPTTEDSEENIKVKGQTEDDWENFMRLCSTLEDITVLHISEPTLDFILNSYNDLSPSLKSLKVLTFVQITSDLLLKHGSIVTESDFMMRLVQIRLKLNPFDLPANDIIRNFMMSQRSTLENLRIIWIPTDSKDVERVDQGYHKIEPNENLAVDNWVIPLTLRDLRSWYTDTENTAPQGWPERSLIVALLLPKLEIVNDELNLKENTFIQITGYPRPPPGVQLEVNDMTAMFYQGRLRELDFEPKEAAEIYEKVLRMQKERLGESHVDTLTTMRHLATISHNAKDESKALKMIKEIREGTNKALKILTAGEDQDERSKMWKCRFEAVFCDGCNANPIRGMWYKCMECKDYDLCPLCYRWVFHGHGKRNFWEISMTFAEGEEEGRYQVRPEWVEWVKGSGELGEKILGLVAGQDENGEEILIARAYKGSALIPGKLIGRKGPCVIVDRAGGEECLVDDFEVLNLSSDQVTWVDVENEEIDRKWAVVGGVDVGGELLYIGRKEREDGRMDVGLVPGTFGKEALCTMTDGVEENLENYQLLVLRKDDAE